MSAAVALSGALHVFLIYGFSLPADSDLGVHLTVIQARLTSPQRSASPQRARTPESAAVPEPHHPVPVVPSPPAPDAVAESATAPDPPRLPSDPEPEPTASAGAEVVSLTIPDPVHYPAKDLDLYPQALKRISPAYPQAARDAQVTGSVTLLVMIDEAGRVVGTSVMDATPDGVFEQAAQLALADAVFFPAQKDGRAVRCRILMKIEFDPADAAQ